MKTKLLGLIVCLAALAAICGEAQAVTSGSLRSIIVQQQRAKVRASYGPANGQCFTQNNFASFRRRNVPGQVVSRLRRSAQMRAAVEQLRRMSAADRERELARCRSIARPTWAALGKISPHGQTQAGHEAELLIAQAIVRLAQEMLAANARA